MKTKNNSTKKTVETVTVETVNVTPEKFGHLVENEVIDKRKPGRPVDPNSPRQLMLKEKQEKREQGLIRRGRPVKDGSKRQEELKRKAELREAGVLSGKRGRPINGTSKRQLRILDLETRRANGTLKLGRPPMKKKDEVTEEN